MATGDEFLKLFKEYMKPPAAFKPLGDFLKPRRFSDLVECLTVYFNAFEPYGAGNERSRLVFYELASRAIGKGDVYFALRVGILVKAKGKVWHERYHALRPRQQRGIDAAIAGQRRSLSPIQRAFLELFDELMDGRKDKQQEIERFTSKLHVRMQGGPLQDCLRAYLEVSQGYERGDQYPSRLVFFGVSHYAITASDAHFAATYEQRVKEADSIWKKRYDALDTTQRAFIDDDIRKKKTLYKEIEHKGKTYKVPEGTYNAGTIAPETSAPDRAVQPTTAAQKEFARLFDGMMRASDDSVKPLEAFLQRSDHQALREAVSYYLRQSQSPGATNNSRSLDIFYGLLSVAIAKGTPYYAFKVESLIATPGTVWAARFDQLPPFRKGDEGEIRKELKKQRERARFLDELKFAYFNKHQVDPDPEALRKFEPVPSKEQFDQLQLVSGALSDFEVATSPKVNSVEMLSKAFDTLSGVLRAQTDRLLLLVLIRACRERRSIPGPVRHLIYLYGLGVFFNRVLNWRPREYYRKGFNQEELDYLLQREETGDRYYNDFALSFEHVTRKNLGDAGVLEICKAQAALHLFAWQRDMRLATMQDGAMVRSLDETLWVKQPEEMRAVRIPVRSRWDSNATVRLRETLGNVFVLWWDPNRGVAYVLLKDFDKVVFELDSYTRLGQVRDDDKFYGEVFRATQHLLVLIPIIFEILGYLPDLVTGGLTGLVKAVVFNVALEKSVESLGLDPTLVQLVLLGVTVAAHAGGPKNAPGHVEADPSAIQQRALSKRTGTPGHGDRAVDVPLTQGDGIGGAGIPSTSRGKDVDIRGVRSEDGSTVMIRPDESPSVGSPAVTRRGVEGDVTEGGIVIRGQADAPPRTGMDELRAAQAHRDDLTQRLAKAERELDQTQHSAGNLEAQIEATKGAKLDATKKAEKLQQLDESLKRLEANEETGKALVASLKRELDATRKTTQKLGEKVLGEVNVPARPTTFRQGGLTVDSWRSDAFLPTSDNRQVLERLLNENVNGDLSKVLLTRNGTLYPAHSRGGNQALWDANPNIIEFAHVRTRSDGGGDVYVIMSKGRNQRFGATTERTGGNLLEEAIVIQGVAIDRMTALALVGKGLPAKVVANAPVIRLVK